MVFDPTLHSPDEAPENLPDLQGGRGDAELSDPDGGIAEATHDRADTAREDDVEGEVDASLVTDVLPADGLPADGEES